MNSRPSPASGSGSGSTSSRANPHAEITETCSEDIEAVHPIASTSTNRDRVAGPSSPQAQADASTSAAPLVSTTWLRTSSSLVGRDAELQTLSGFFEVPYNGLSLLVLSGPEGIGKTRLIHQFAETLSQSRKSTPIFHIDATSTTALDQSLTAIAQSKGVGNTTEAALTWLTSLREEFFLCIDCADNPAIDITPYLPSSLKSNCKHARILLSTRLDAEEARKRFADISGAAGLLSFLTLGPLEEAGGRELLVKQARLEENPKQADFALELAKELDFQPIAIIQASAVIRDQKWTAKDYLNEFSKLKAQLIDESLITPFEGEGCSTDVTWRLSYERLSPTALNLLRICSQFHHLSITEQMFQDAFHSFSHFVNPDAPYRDEEIKARDNAQGFLDAFAKYRIGWSSDVFEACMDELHFFCLIRRTKTSARHPGPTVYSIRTPIHTGIRASSSSLSTNEAFFILASALRPHCSVLPRLHAEVQFQQLLPHVQRLLETPRGSDYTTIHPSIMSLLATCIHHGTHRYADAEPLYRSVVSSNKTDLGLAHPSTIRAIAAYGHTFSDRDHLRRVEEMQLQVLEILRAERGQDNLKTLSAMCDLARTFRKTGKFRQAVKMQKEAVDRLVKTVGFNDERHLDALSGLGDIFYDVGSLVEERKLRQNVLAGRTAIFGEEHEQTVQALSDLAQSATALGDYEAAWAMQRKVLEQRRAMFGANSLDTVWSMAPISTTLLEMGPQKARVGEQIARGVYHHTRALLGPDHPTTLRALALISLTLRRQGWYDQAKNLDREVLQKRREMFGADHHDTLFAQEILAGTLTSLDRFSEATNLHLDVVPRMQKLGSSHFKTLRSQAKLAAAFLGRGMAEEGAALDAMILVRRLETLGVQHIDTVQSLISAAGIIHDFGYRLNAQRLMKRAVQTASRMMGPAHPLTIQANETYAFVHRQLSKVAKHPMRDAVAVLYNPMWPLLERADHALALAPTSTKAEPFGVLPSNSPDVSKRLSRLAAPLGRLMRGGKSQ